MNNLCKTLLHTGAKLLCNNQVTTGAILVLLVVTYLPIMNNYFFADDFRLLIVGAQKGFSIPGLLVTNAEHWVPIQNMLLALLYKVFGADPAGYYWVNILLHVANTYLVILFFSKIFSCRMLGVMTGALFGFCASHWNASTWITTQTHLLATLFLLISALLFVEYIYKKRFLFLLLSWISHFLMLLSYTVGFEVPILFFLLFWLLTYRRLSKTSILLRGVTLGFSYVCIIIMYFYLRSVVLSATPYASLFDSLGGGQTLLTKIPKAMLFFGFGLYFSYVRPFSGAYFLDFTSFRSFPSSAEMIYVAGFIVFIIFLLDWSPQGIRRDWLLLFVLFCWLCLEYFPYILGRMNFGFKHFIYASRYRYLPCIPAAALMITVCKSLRPFRDIHQQSSKVWAIFCCFLCIIVINIIRFETIEHKVDREGKKFEKVTEVFLVDFARLLNTHKRGFQIIDEPLIDIDYPAGWCVWPSMIAQTHYTKEALQKVDFIVFPAEKYANRRLPIHLIHQEIKYRNHELPLYVVKNGYLQPYESQ